MTFATDNDIGIVPSKMLKHHNKASDMNIASRVKKTYRVSFAFGHTKSYGISFPVVCFIPIHPEMFRFHPGGATKTFIVKPIDNDNDFIGTCQKLQIRQNVS